MTEVYPLKWITESLAVGYAPRATEHLQTIMAAGISGIVNLCAECYDLDEIEGRFGFEVYYLPIPDEGAPDLHDLRPLIAWIQAKIDTGDRILVHCRYGIGRTGTAVLAYLLSAGYEFETARKVMKKTPAWPASRDQEELIDAHLSTLPQAAGQDTPQFRKPEKTFNFFERWRRFSKWR